MLSCCKTCAIDIGLLKTTYLLTYLLLAFVTGRRYAERGIATANRLSVCEKTSAMWASLYKDALGVNLKQRGIDLSALGDDTQDRSAWRTLCHEAVTQFEDSRIESLESGT